MKEIENAYDIESFFKEYQDMRSKKINANELIEMPIIKTMLPDLKDLSVIDLGCGTGCMTSYFIGNKVKSILGVDVSQNMITEAINNNKYDNVLYKVLPLEQLSTINEKFDLAYSSLAFHYIEDFDKLIQDINSLLNDDGILVFSQEHPLVTASILEKSTSKYVEMNNKRYYYLSDYNNMGERHSKVAGTMLLTKYHRNFSYIINTLINHGFTILEVKESIANKEAIQLVDKYKYQLDRPYFLFIKAKKIRN